MDDHDAASFAATFPDAAVFSVDRVELVGALAQGSRRVLGPWRATYRSKTAQLVAHLRAGGQVSPPAFTADFRRPRCGGRQSPAGLDAPPAPILLSRADALRLTI